MRSRSLVTTVALVLALLGVGHAAGAECLRGLCVDEGQSETTAIDATTSRGACHAAPEQTTASQRAGEDRTGTVGRTEGETLDCCPEAVTRSTEPISRTATPDVDALPSAEGTLAVAATTQRPPATDGAPPGKTPPLFRLHRALLL